MTKKLMNFSHRNENLDYYEIKGIIKNIYRRGSYVSG
mgnify:CR=1 FL=1